MHICILITHIPVDNDKSKLSALLYLNFEVGEKIWLVKIFERACCRKSLCCLL